jgi:hypothetical protein
MKKNCLMIDQWNGVQNGEKLGVLVAVQYCVSGPEAHAIK